MRAKKLAVKDKTSLPTGLSGRKFKTFEDLFNDPENIAQRVSLKKKFSNDIELMAHFAVILMEDMAILQTENEDLTRKLNKIIQSSAALSSDSPIDARVKRRISEKLQETDSTNPIANTFQSALTISRTLNAQTNSAKAHAKHREPRQYVIDQWAAHRAEYEDNKTEFARHYARLVMKEFGVKISEKQIREVWLKDTPPAS